MADTELLPCPFCGGAARIQSNRDWHRLCADHDDECVFDADDHVIMYPAQPGYLIQIAEDWNRRAALASRPAEVDDEGLPPLPPEAARAMKGEVAFFVKWQDAGKKLRGSLMLFTAEQFRQGQRDAVAADRARMPAADEISDAITEAFNLAFTNRDWEARDHWRDVGNRFSQWAAPSHTTNKEK